MFDGYSKSKVFSYFIQPEYDYRLVEKKLFEAVNSSVIFFSFFLNYFYFVYSKVFRKDFYLFGRNTIYSRIIVDEIFNIKKFFLLKNKKKKFFWKVLLSNYCEIKVIVSDADKIRRKTIKKQEK